MTAFADRPLEEQIAQWRAYVRRRPALHGPDVEELEGHLRDQLAALTKAGLAGDEAFLIAVKRMGSLDALSREFARAHSERLWKQLVMAPGTADESPNGTPAETRVVLILAIAAAVAIKVPELFGVRIGPGGDEPFYARNASLFVLPLLTLYFLWKRGSGVASGLRLALPFVAAAVFANVYPFHPRGDTEVLTALHLPIALWLAVGFAYVRSRWFADGGRMDFVRFSGELAIYYVLIALGGVVFTGFTMMMFRAIDMNAEWLAQRWLIPCGAAGPSHRVLAGGGEAKRHRENGARADEAIHAAVHGSAPRIPGHDGVDRQPHQREAGGTDRLRSAAGSCRRAGVLRRLRARPVSTARLFRRPAIAARGERARGRCGGAHRDRRAHLRIRLHPQQSRGAWRESHSARQLGVDGLALCALRVSHRGSFADLERWQIAYLPVYSVWAALVVAVFPPIFSYR